MHGRWVDANGYREGAAVVEALRSQSHLIVCRTLIAKTVDSFLA